MTLTRRRVLQLSSLAAAGAAFAAAPGVRQLLAATGTARNLLTSPVTVPRDFLGMHFHRWPEGKPVSPAPTYGYGAVRSHDYRIAWNNINTAKGQYDWARMDNWVQVHSAARQTLLYTLYGTPTWASSMPTHPDAYGAMGGAAPPKDLTTLSDFIRALLTRYNSGGKKQIRFMETWNEPGFKQDFKGFWWGTPADLAKLGKVVYQTAKAADPSIKVLSPGFTGVFSRVHTVTLPPNEHVIHAYMAAQDGGGTTGSNWCDGIAIHPYNTEVSNPAHPDHDIEEIIGQVNTSLRNLNLSLPVYTTELGYVNMKGTFQQASLAEKGNILRRNAAVQAALGIQAVYFYSHDDNYIGNPSIHPEISKALNDINTRISGKTLKQVTVLPDGQVKVATRAETFTW